ncbi:MAG: hypothetical protein HN548_04915, partial [Opitutae bacterium]|nr:hypothetical protein [Opitutae bacterium]
MMNKIILPLLASLIASFFSSCIQTSSTGKVSTTKDKTVMLHWLDLDDTGIVRLTGNDGNLSKSTKAFTGEAIETFEQSPTKSVSQWKDGKKHGTTIEYFYNGRKRRAINYKLGIKDGIAEEFRITGELLRRETYREGNLNGPKSEWHPNGAKILEVQMRQGKPHGEALEWYPDGLEKSSTIYRHGLREGPSSEWYSNGQRKLGLFYQKDKQHGQRTIWYEDGKKRLTAQFDEDMMEGNSQGWFQNGQQQFDYNFRKNLEHGVCTEWDSNGKKISEIRFVDGTPTQNLLTGEKIDNLNAEKPKDFSKTPSTSVNSDPSNPIKEITPAKPNDDSLFTPPSNIKDASTSDFRKDTITPVPTTTLEPDTISLEPKPNTKNLWKESAPPLVPPANLKQAQPSTLENDKINIIPPPPEPPVPTFNPFKDEPSKPTVNPVENSNNSSPPSSFDPFQNEPNEST